MGHSIWNPYGLHSGYGMKNGWVASQKIVHMESMEWGWTPSIPYGFHMENTGECKDLTREDFTLPHRFHVESMWTLDIFFGVVAQPIFCPESMWSPCGVQLESSCSIWTTWTPPWNTGIHPARLHMESTWIIAFNCLMLFTTSVVPRCA